MTLSGFTIARNITRFHYPFVESIRSILPVCDEFVINLGDSEDDTERLIRSIDSPKIRVIRNRWDFSQGKEVLSHQTNLAMQACRGDWGFYLQADEVVHEADLPRIEAGLRRYANRSEVDAMRFSWLHFYGSYWRYRIDSGWYQKQDRIVRLNGQIESYGDAYAFRRKDGAPLRRRHTGAYIYHYGWVQSPAVMTRRRLNAEQIGFVSLEDGERNDDYQFGDLNRFPAYFGTHPEVMAGHVNSHELSRQDFERIRRKYWWHPLFIGRIRCKTPKRVKQRIQ